MLYAVIMAGGKGERFWPASRMETPKQLLRFFGQKTLLEMTVERMQPLVPYESILVVTNIWQAEAVKKVLPMIPEKNIIAEPIGRNTAPCIGMAAQFIEHQYPSSVMLVLPADHIIASEEHFIRNMNDAAEVADEKRNLITFGIKPHGPETGYGYIKAGEWVKCGKKTIFAEVGGFFEKPDEETARIYYESGDYLWNSGMFVWRSDVILNAIKEYLPDMYTSLTGLRFSDEDGIDSESLRNVYDEITGISIDYGVMEKSRDIRVAYADFIWDDVGSWTAIERHEKKDSQGNIVDAQLVKVDTKNCIIVGDKRLIATVGIKDLIIVDTDDAVLICHRDQAQDVKKIVEQLKGDEEYKKYL